MRYYNIAVEIEGHPDNVAPALLRRNSSCCNRKWKNYTMKR